VLLAILIDNIPEETLVAWNIVHDLIVNEEAIRVIKSKSAKLIALSGSMESWKGSTYGKWIHIVNAETLDAVRKLWTCYTAYELATLESNKTLQARKVQARESVDKPVKEPIPILAASFGMFSEYAKSVAYDYSNGYWFTGTSDPCEPPILDPVVNPLLIYTATAIDKFIVPANSSPISIYHLRKAAKSFNAPVENEHRTIGQIAKAQFKQWCRAFVDFIRNPDGRNLRMRFVSADPISFCFALQRRSDPTKRNLINMSRDWSGIPLTIHDDIPSTFNVIDTSTLVDTCGGINLLVATIPLLQVDPSTALHMKSQGTRSSSEETLLLDDILCSTQRNLMCALLGLSPVESLTRVSTQGLAQDCPFLLDSSSKDGSLLMEIIWKFPWSGDQNIATPAPISYDGSADFGEVLRQLYRNMRGKMFPPRVATDIDDECTQTPVSPPSWPS
jgi:hypothetical protein